MKALLTDEARAAIEGERAPGIGTYGGIIADLNDPEHATIRIEDVAHGLALTCRFGGHTRTFYSVAEHACFVRDLLRALGADGELTSAGLHHDDAEAYTGDVPRPIKRQLGPNWRDLEWRWDRAVERAAGLKAGVCTAAAVKEADNFAVAYEAIRLMDVRNWGYTEEGLAALEALALPDGVEWHGGLTPRSAELLYLSYAAEETDGEEN